MAEITAYKCTRHDGTDFHSGTVDYAAALASGQPLEVPDADPPRTGTTGSVCGRGLHVCDTPRKTIRFTERVYAPYRWFEVTYLAGDQIDRDKEKIRVRRLRVVREILMEELFGADLVGRIRKVREQIRTWKEIPWLRPGRAVTDQELQALYAQWRAALSLWARRKELPDAVTIVRDRAAADAVVTAAAAAIVAEAAAVAYADATAEAAAAAYAAAANEAANEAAYAADTNPEAAAADANDDADRALRHWRLRWYVRPRYILWHAARWQIAGMEQPNPWAPLVEIYRLGCMPIGCAHGHLVIYAPE